MTSIAQFFSIFLLCVEVNSPRLFEKVREYCIFNLLAKVVNLCLSMNYCILKNYIHPQEGWKTEMEMRFYILSYVQ